MDSVTQLALGAAVGEATMGRRVGNRALLWGGLCGTLPDLDVFIPLGDAVSDFTYHRSASHSLIVLAMLTPVMVWLITKLHPSTLEHKQRWYLSVYLVFATHVLLDSFTAYGTQIFWPVVTTPMTWSTIFIIDPLYTLPLLVGIIAALVMTRDSDRGHRLNQAGLMISTLYLGWSLAAKVYVQGAIEDALKSQNVAYQRIFTTPAPFNTLLWRAVVMDESGYYEAYYSLFDGDHPVGFNHYPSDRSLLDGIEDQWPVQRLQWFSKGFYAVEQQQQDIVISDLRMGFEPDYIFRFKVGEISNPHAIAVSPVQLPVARNFDQLKYLWKRIWNTEFTLNANIRAK
ncbi:metal-dependent hydrolase [Kaarinaea lacus]